MPGSPKATETQLEDVDSVKRWLRSRRKAAGLSQEELGAYMGEGGRAVLNAEKLGDPKHQLPRGYPFFRMLQRLGAIVPDAPVPSQPTLDDRLRALEALVANLPTKNELRDGLEVLREAIDAQASPDNRRARPGD